MHLIDHKTGKSIKLHSENGNVWSKRAYLVKGKEIEWVGIIPEGSNQITAKEWNALPKGSKQRQEAFKRALGRESSIALGYIVQIWKHKESTR